MEAGPSSTRTGLGTRGQCPKESLAGWGGGTAIPGASASSGNGAAQSCIHAGPAVLENSSVQEPKCGSEPEHKFCEGRETNRKQP